MSTEELSAEWAFTYDGPIAALDNRSCWMCNTAHGGKCPNLNPHENHPPGCSTCHAAELGHCPNHCGAIEALQSHETTHPIHEKLYPAFTVARLSIAAYLKTITDDGSKNVYIKMEGRVRGDSEMLSMEFVVK